MVNIETPAASGSASVQVPLPPPPQSNVSPMVNAALLDQVRELEKQGFGKEKQLFKLLLKTNGDVNAVKSFLEARSQLKQVEIMVRTEKKEAKRQAKMEKKQEKKEYKLIKGREKRDRKNCKEWKLKKEQKWEEKRAKKEGKANRKAEKQRLRNEASDGDTISLARGTNDMWPKEQTHLYLDGNNMLFVLAPIRSMVLNKRSVRAAEKALTSLAMAFARALHLEKTVLVFDDTNQLQNENFVSGSKEDAITSSFEVRTARPDFATSDDALVDWVLSQEGSNAHKGIYVTSDRELIGRLKEVGGVVCKPKEWFLYAAKILSGIEVAPQDLDQWFEEWYASHGSDVPPLHPRIGTANNNNSTNATSDTTATSADSMALDIQSKLSL